MYYVNKKIAQLYRISGKRDTEDFLRLDMNENPGGLPNEFVQSVLKEITPEYLSTYPDKSKLLMLLERHIKCTQDHFFIGNGSDEIIRLIFECFTYEGSNIVTCSPTFAMYDVYAKMYGVINKKIEYSSEFTLNIDDFQNAIDDSTALVFVLNPNNPIGTVLTEKELEGIIQKAQKHNSLVVIDEAYYYFYKNTFLNYVFKNENIIILRTFSKLMSLANCRLGFAISTKEIIDILHNSSCSYNVNGLAIKFAEHILQNEKLIDELIDKHAEGKKYLEESLVKMGYEVKSLEGNFLFFKPKSPVKELEEKLYDRKVLVKTYSDGILKDYIRVSTGEKKYMDMFVNILKDVD